MQLAGNKYRRNPIQILSNGSVLVDYGPMHMVIRAFEKGKPLVKLEREGAHLARKVLEDLANFLPVIKKKSTELEVEASYPEVIRRMINATKRMGEPGLTPLAAVAGTASDVVADFMFSRGGTKIIVDNGGDIAIRLREGEKAGVGVKTGIHEEKPTYILSIDSTLSMGGVATSGLGGRSFTKGIASAVMVVSDNASLSDSAATVIGNFTDTVDPSITRSLAESIYADTDIKGEWVTVEVGKLSSEKIEEALTNGLTKANSICQKGLIKGALIAVQGKVVWTESLKPYLKRLSFRNTKYEIRNKEAKS